MANIIISMHTLINNKNISNQFTPFYENLINGLKENGNNILCYYHQTYFKKFEILPEKIKNEIIDFEPDLCIFFNNNFYDISKIVDCPIIIYDVDSPNLYENKEILLKKTNRFKFLVNQSHGVNLIEDFTNTKKENIKYIPPFTGLKNSKIEQNINISFLGSHWLWEGCDFTTKFIREEADENDRKTALKVFEEFIKNPFYTSEEIYEKNNFQANKKINIDNPRKYAARYSGIKRGRYLATISELGLEIRGEHYDHFALNYFPELALSFNPEPTYSMEKVSKFYNSSKISFNINHIQAISGFSWRVCDIMASNACLVSEDKPDFKKLFPKVKIPSYSNQYEAYEVCKKILKEENLRKDTISMCNEVIDKNFRFQNTLEAIENFIGLSLHSKNKGSLTLISLDIQEKKSKNLQFKNKIQYKIWKHLDKKLRKKEIIS